MTDSINTTGFDISGKMKQLFEAAEVWEIDVDKTMGKGKLIDEIFGAKCEKIIFNHFYHGLSKRCHHFAKQRRNLQNVLN
jgi:hypothetical protein